MQHKKSSSSGCFCAAEQLINISKTKTKSMRREVLNAFKSLHRARQYVFQGDERALYEARKQINEHFRKNITVQDPKVINQMVQLAHDVERELRTNVIQAVEKQSGVYELRITEETTKMDNVEFDPYAAIPPPRKRKTKSTSEECCGGGCQSDKSVNKKV